MHLAQTALKQTPLAQRHLALGAKMVAFGGWNMPLQYDGILAEHAFTRREVSVFDTSHMGEFIVEGPLRLCGLDRLVTQSLSDLAVGACRYGVLLKEDGGVLDDLIVYRLADQKWMAVVNGATMEKDARHFAENLNPQSQFVNVSSSTGKLDVQGPKSRDLLARFIKGFEKLKFYTFGEFDVLGTKAIVSRTGYTGELGYEIYFPWEQMPILWDKILSLGAKPAGLGSRDVLRLEMGYSLYGHELDETISPLSAGLEKFICWDKDFIGKAELLKQKKTGFGRHLVAFVSATRRSARADFKIFSVDGHEVGVVTSATFSPALERGIGLGFVECPYSKKGEKLFVGDGQKNFEVVVTDKPFYKQGTFRN